MTGRFVSFEGIDGVGKTSVLREIADWLQQSYRLHVTCTREPGGAPLSERIRTLVLDETMPADAELLLICAARCVHLQQTILPALARGEWVLTDRFVHSSIAYQGAGRGLGIQRVLHTARGWCSRLPDLALWFDAPPGVARDRLSTRGGTKNRFDAADETFAERVRGGYAVMATMDTTIRRIDADTTLAATVTAAKAQLAPLLPT